MNNSNETTELDVNQAFAIGHAHMLYQAAIGEHTPREGEALERYEAIVSYAKTGQCTGDDPEVKKVVDKLLDRQS